MEPTLLHTQTHVRLVQREQRQLSLLGAVGWLASFKGYGFDLEVTFCRQVVDGLQVEVVGELECVLV